MLLAPLRIHLFACKKSHRSVETNELFKVSAGKPAVYCSTYGKYFKDCSLNGEWVDLTSFTDYSDFMKFCNNLHADEEYPELMFQDYMNFPKQFYNESGISEKDFYSILEYYEFEDKDAFRAYCDIFGKFDELDFFDKFMGNMTAKKILLYKWLMIVLTWKI